MREMKDWYVLYTKPRNEKKVDERLRLRGFNSYCPLMTTVRQWSDRKKKVMLPMFPSYTFVKVEEYKREDVLADPGVLNFVFWQGEPAKVREKEIEAIRRIADEGQSIQIESNEMISGHSLIIPNGPFKGLVGKINSVDNKNISIFIQPLGCVIKFKL